jgi:pimeloyl-ACP methyl ester carboxylesterase
VCRLSVRDHAEDALRILDAEGVDRAVWVGWSMGVQVSLEAAAIDPKRFAGLVLMNGTYGHVFSSGFQPWFRLPLLPRYMHEITEWVRNKPLLSRVLAKTSKHGTFVTLGLFWLVVGRRALALRPAFQQYTDDVYRSENFPNFLRLFQELDAHSAYHHLPRIQVPALVMSGRFDILTPAYQSREITRRLPGAEHVHINNGSHFLLLERPEQVLPRIEDFVERRARW